MTPERTFFWTGTGRRPAVPGEPGDLVWNGTSWEPGAIGGNFKWNSSTNCWDHGPGGTHKWNGSVWVPVTEAGYGGSHYWNGSVWIPNPGNPAEAASLIVRMTTAPSGDRADLIGELIADLKTAGIWDKLDVLYILAAHDAQAARLNWKADLYNLTAVNSPTFTQDRGYAGDGSTSYCDTAWDPATNGVQYAQNSATIGVWCRTSAQSAGILFGTSTAAAATLQPRSGSDLFAYRINQTTPTTAANTDGAGFFAASRSGASATQGYKNGATLGSAGSQSSASLSTVDVNIGRASSTFNAGQVSAACAGANLNATEHAALYTALNTYLTAVGAA